MTAFELKAWLEKAMWLYKGELENYHVTFKATEDKKSEPIENVQIVSDKHELVFTLS